MLRRKPWVGQQQRRRRTRLGNCQARRTKRWRTIVPAASSSASLGGNPGVTDEEEDMANCLIPSPERRRGTGRDERQEQEVHGGGSQWEAIGPGLCL
ncbi:hypothetical protein HPP92_002403 [Vanilla planifolia]|uniref:Uncharacterized protein n=1 Tax=Vanilla planifolia TaxID=51239 RepID=A0A835S5A1_VANPL|nr:hypothetical protein HPP92_002403 [Vanilla planifolia]